jgi:hypothetical protein
MATTTATITMSSTDLTSDALSLSKTSTITKAGTTTGLTQTSGIGRKTTASSSQYTLFDATDTQYTDDKATKVYVLNTSTTSTEYFIITIGTQVVGRIYAGDWAFIPWAATADFKVTPSETTEMTLEYAVIYE